MSRTFVHVLLGILLAIVLIAGAGGAFIWWKISGLKAELLGDVGKALGAQVQVASIDFDLWKGELHAAGITLTNERASAPWDKGDISQASPRGTLFSIRHSARRKRRRVITPPDHQVHRSGRAAFR
jgi:hypothetical protein